ncbi:uncharacterized protein LOC124171594 [Ischnura elegans]|uniref:uncharacterized protein LOC124171594 n=1 Tax=Ischnura elegans TaxID=197161 RepID=UPI001ED8A851|nr:uncharacterized protein LOC124171594 [Ischnura elegans]
MVGWESGGPTSGPPPATAEEEPGPPDGSGGLDAAVCRQFFDRWRRRNARLAERWGAVSGTPSCGRTARLDDKIQDLKREIGVLVAQDTSLFQQLFQIHDELEAIKEKVDSESRRHSIDSSETSSLSGDQDHPESSTETSSTGSTPSSPLSDPAHGSNTQMPREKQRRSLVHHTSFVRQRISYPPTARNRYCRTKGRSNHQSQGSYDSGIQTSDQEIFV